MSMTLQAWGDTPPSCWNKEEEYRQHIEPLIQALYDETIKRGFPMFAALAYGSDGTGAHCETIFSSGGDAAKLPESILALKLVFDSTSFAEIREVIDALEYLADKREDAKQGA